jgi:hypothetical protein
VALTDGAGADGLNSISVIFLKHRTPDDQLIELGAGGMKRSMSETIKNPRITDYPP